MPDRHVQPQGEEWTVTVPGDDQVTARTATEVEAVERAVTIIAQNGGGEVVVHGEDGEVLETRHVDADTTDASRTAAEVAENAGVEGAVETVEAVREGGAGGSADELAGHTPTAVHEVGGTDADTSTGSDAGRNGSSVEGLREATRATLQEAGDTAETAASEAGDTAEDVADEASTTAKKVAGHTRTAARRAGATAEAAGSGVRDQVEAVSEGDKSLEAAAEDTASIAQTTAGHLAGQAEGTAREVAGETRAAGRRAAARVDAGARQAGQTVASGADRVADRGADVGDEAEDAADRVGQQIHAYTEAVAAPLDQLAHALNPVRVTGRVVGVVVAGGLHLFGVGATRGTAAAQQSAHRVTGR
ncbi:MAG: hypothetical protein K0S40_4001 [Actinomycetospora sp.]|jgi:hypothetical protein|nr:hypothetical protein [Actinomycetospora sp.]